MKNSTLILIVALIISLIGILLIYSSTYRKEGLSWQTVYKRQVIWLLIGLLCFFAMSNLNYRRLWDVTYILYIIVFLLLFLVFILGVVRLGAQRWLKFIWFNFQPSEIAKLAMIIFLARYFSKKETASLSLVVSKFGIVRALILPIFFAGILMGLIIEQPDLGTAVILFLVFFAMVYLAGVNFRYLFLLLLITIFSLPILWHGLRVYQKERLLVFLNPNLDPLGAGYTIIQSKIAIGSGGIFGKGWFSGTQSQLRFLPESHTDFIFAAFAEQCGLIGNIILLLLYYILVRQAILIAMRTQDLFGRLLAFGISLMLGIQIFVNVAMNLGLAPVVGIPLPLMSYGGSSMLVTFIALGILVNIDKTRSVF